ncbi:MAG: type II toxin-antitoxin system HicA family toxin [Planctomycetota bacterium]
MRSFCNVTEGFDGVLDKGGRGSHRNLKHPSGAGINISGRSGDGAKPYQELDVRRASRKHGHERE